MAKRKRRKGAGPPPVHRRASAEPARAEAAPKRRPGEPIPPSMRGVLTRAAIVALLFVPYLIYVVGESTGGAILVALIAFALMIPLGMLLDRLRYRRQMRRWEQARAARPPAR